MTGQWRRERDRESDRRPALPIWPFEVSNGEFVPLPPSRRDRVVTQQVLDRLALTADRTNTDRRRFLTRAGAVAASLTVFNACASGREGAIPPPSSSVRSTTSSPTTTTTTPPPTTSTDPGGEYVVPEPEDEEACVQELGDQGEFIFDIHTHHVMPDGVWRENAPRIEQMINRLAPAGCQEGDRLECLNRVSYITNMFLGSDTTIALLSDVPNSGPDDAPIPFDAKVGTAELMEAITVAGQQRVLIHDVIAPNFGEIERRIEEMAISAATDRVSAFKVYTAWGPDSQGFSLADPAVGIPVIEQARSLGVNVLCAHKGLPLLEFDRRFNGPEDICQVAAMYPDMDFIVYHGAFERETTERAYDPSRTATGINSLIKAMDDYGIPVNGNVHAELGTTWRETMRDPTQAAHVLGKLLSRLGDDNVMWGTDAIWLGSPQAQIMAFRSFEITQAFQETHGYPALTPERKAKILGLNAARIFGVDPTAITCGIDTDLLSSSKGELEVLVDDGLVPSPYEPVGFMTRREMMAWASSLRQPWAPV